MLSLVEQITLEALYIHGHAAYVQASSHAERDRVGIKRFTFFLRNFFVPL